METSIIKNKTFPIPEEDEIDLVELLLYLLQRWVWLLLSLIIGCAAAILVYRYTVTPLYRANAEIYITNSGTVVNIQDIQLSAELTVDYEEILLSRKVLKKVIEDQNLDLDFQALEKMITITNPTDSHCLVISTTSASPQEAIDITNSLIRYGIDQIYRTVGKDEPSIIDAAEADAVDEVQTSWKKYAAIGGLACLVLTGAFFTLLFMLDTTLKTNEDIEKYLNLNVLSVVPEAAHEKKKRGGHDSK